MCCNPKTATACINVSRTRTSGLVAVQRRHNLQRRLVLRVLVDGRRQRGLNHLVGCAAQRLQGWVGSIAGVEQVCVRVAWLAGQQLHTSASPNAVLPDGQPAPASTQLSQHHMGGPQAALPTCTASSLRSTARSYDAKRWYVSTGSLSRLRTSCMRATRWNSGYRGARPAGR